MDAPDILLRPTVLVVEDEAMLRIVVADRFEQAGFVVLEAGTADEAITVFSRDPKIDLVFTDVRMPGDMDGLALTAWVREHYPETLVLLTSGDLGHNRTQADLIEVEHFFQKPYCLDKVVECVLSSLAKKAA